MVVTRRFDPPASVPALPAPVTVRFAGRRRGVDGTPRERRSFRPREGRRRRLISVTVRIGGVNPGSWEVRAQAFAGRRSQETPRVGGSRGAARKPGDDEAVTTCVKPFAKVPGLVRVGWPAMAMLGMALGVVIQAPVAAEQGTGCKVGGGVSLVGPSGGLGGGQGVVRGQTPR